MASNPVNTPTPTTLKYAPLVALNLTEQAVNFADALDEGHRVQVAIAPSVLNAALVWNRASGSDRPVGSFKVSDATAFTTALGTALTNFDDLDGIATSLDFSAGRLTPSGNQTGTVNDLVLQYVLYKVYGLSAFDVSNKVYNVSDAASMVTNTAVATAITDSFSLTANNARNGAVDQMFRDLLAADPARYFDNNGKQITGLFEVNADAADTNGSWLITAGDIIEIKMEFAFLKQVSKRSVRSQQQPLDDPTIVPPATQEAITEEIVIPAGHKLKVRLQLKATTPTTPPV